MCKVVLLHNRYAWFEHLLFMFFVCVFLLGFFFFFFSLWAIFHRHSGPLPSSGSQLFICNTLKRHWVDANTTSAGCQHKCIDPCQYICLMSAKRQQFKVQMGKCCWPAVGLMPSFGHHLIGNPTPRRYWKPDVVPMSACPPARSRGSVGFDRHFVGI